ncbi:PE-PGRS family protein [Streptomyces sp. NPDC101249]|uniref:PE-PGRS family protein n=1 Tax=unclassified Streptomyces TaxID=2593676 RepID=UPI0038263F16
MRTVNPDDLERLADLMDGRGGLASKLDEAFSRAASLGVTDRLASLRPMRTWIAETAPDLRKRAAIARDDQVFERGDRETYSEWLARVEAHGLAKAPGLDGIGEKKIADFLDGAGDIAGVVKVGGTTTFAGLSLTGVLYRNSWHSGLLRAGVKSTWWDRGGTIRKTTGASLRGFSVGEIRSLVAPGSWMPGQVGNAFARSSLYQDASRIPFTASRRLSLLGTVWDGFRAMPVLRSPAVSRGIELVVGSDELAMKYGGRTHSEALVSRAGHTSLVRVFRSASYLQKLNNARPAVIAAGKARSPFLKGAGAAAGAGGFIRWAGIGTSIVSTGISVANVCAQGNPRAAFKKKGAGYVADLAEVGFNASLTAAMVAPNPVTVGLAVGTGILYGGAKAVEHWEDIKTAGGKATDWVGDNASKFGKGVAQGAKSAARAVNPMSWF